MRRALVLTHEAARHPFRASLPPHVYDLGYEDAQPRLPWRKALWADLQGYVQTYLACFVACVAFII